MGLAAERDRKKTKGKELSSEILQNFKFGDRDSDLSLNARAVASSSYRKQNKQANKQTFVRLKLSGYT